MTDTRQSLHDLSDALKQTLNAEPTIPFAHDANIPGIIRAQAGILDRIAAFPKDYPNHPEYRDYLVRSAANGLTKLLQNEKTN